MDRIQLAGVAGFEPTNARVKVWCLTAWLYPIEITKSRHRPLFREMASSGLKKIKKMGWINGFEPSASRATIWRSNQLSYIHRIDGVPGGTRTPNLLLRRQLLYPAELQAHDSTVSARTGFLRDADMMPNTFSLLWTEVERVMGIEPTCSAWKADILPLNYTRACQLCNFIMLTYACQALFPHKHAPHSHCPFIQDDV